MPPARRLRGSQACRLPSLGLACRLSCGVYRGNISQLLVVAVAASNPAAAVVRVCASGAAGRVQRVALCIPCPRLVHTARRAVHSLIARARRDPGGGDSNARHHRRPGDEQHRRTQERRHIEICIALDLSAGSAGL